MIPPFEPNGYLPPGIYEATLLEIEQRYVYNKAREWLFLGLTKLVKELKSAGCRTLYLDGSYITDKEKPNDYDAAWEFAGVDNTIDPLLRDGIDLWRIKSKYLGDVICYMPEIFDHVNYFQTDKHEVPKGIIKINLEKADE